MSPRSASRIKNKEDAFTALADTIRARARNPNIEDYQPHEKQSRFHRSTKTGRQLIGGNRSGKTVGGATEAIWYATGTHPYKKLPWEPPLRLRVVTVDFIQGLEKIVLPEIRRWLPQKYLVNQSWDDSWSAKLKTLTFENNSFIEFLSYEQELEKFAGTSRHGVWFDEEPPKDIYIECLLRLIDTGGHWWMTMTPVEGMTWTFDDIYEKQDPNIDVIEVDMDENPHLNEESKKILLSGLSQDELDARKHGRYVSLGGLIYKEFVPELHVIKPTLPGSDWLHFEAMDHGYTNATCWLWCAVDRDGRIVVYDEHYQSNMLVKEHAKVVHLKRLEHKILPAYSVGDPSIKGTNAITGTSVQLEYAREGVFISPADNNVEAGIDAVKARLKMHGNFPRLFITENCEKTLWEIRRYRWATWKDSRSRLDKNAKEVPQKKDDHAMDTLRYAVASRPEVDDGTALPQRVTSSVDATTAYNPDGIFLDKEAVSIGSRVYDTHLGEEF